jgi:hypothetical protein
MGESTAKFARNSVGKRPTCSLLEGIGEGILAVVNGYLLTVSTRIKCHLREMVFLHRSPTPRHTKEAREVFSLVLLSGE